jgi:hypothetical protein
MIAPAVSRLGLALAIAGSLQAVACVGRDAGAAGADASTHATSASTAPAPTAQQAAPLATRAAENGGDVSLCPAICARSEPLHCREAATCVRRCEAMRAMPICQAAVRESLECFASVPTTSWTCNEHGLPSVRVGMCDAEQARAAKCLAANPPLAPK